jgi:uncharacterized radical SAM superfamily Fe-S cluster-containing enzyme
MSVEPGELRGHRFLGTTQSLCPECLALVTAKIVARDGRVYFRKFCPKHGLREDFVCSDERYFDLDRNTVPGRLPQSFALEPRNGCPYDCGLCSEHEQHTCIALLEINSACNLECPVCFAGSGPGGEHLAVAECRRAIEHLVAAEGRPEILQLSGGEPTIHPRFIEILEEACRQPIDLVMINTNGIRFAGDRGLCEAVAARRDRVQIYLQFDGLNEASHLRLRGQSLLASKMRAIERFGEYGIQATLVVTLAADENLDQVGSLIDFAVARPWITGVSFQPQTYVGRCELPESLERRVTFPDILQAVEKQTAGRWRAADFFPVPCAHPNAHTLAYGYRREGQVVPLTRLMDVHGNLDLLANGISLNRHAAREVIERFVRRQACGPGCGCGSSGPADPPLPQWARCSGAAGTGQPSGVEGGLDPRWAADFLGRALREELSAADVFRITTTSFMDAYNFDLRQLIRSCVHHVLPSGHVIPFDAYNVLYRTGIVRLPELRAVPPARRVAGIGQPGVGVL